MPTDITWTNTTVALGALQPWQRNPRKSSKKQAQKMLESWDKFGQLGEAVLEPFSGSGTTLIACEQLGRKARAVEISPGYVAVALERFFQATGIEPTLAE